MASVSDAQSAQFNQRFYRARLLEPLTLDFRPDRILVKPKIGADLNLLLAANGAQVLRSFPAMGNLQVHKLPDGLNADAVISAYQATGLVVYAEDRDMAEQAVNSIEFFRNESCGKCVPCRLGSQKFVSLGSNLLNGQVREKNWKEEIWPLMKEMGSAIQMASICGLGRSVPVPLTTVAAFFDQDVSKHLANGEVKGEK